MWLFSKAKSASVEAGTEPNFDVAIISILYVIFYAIGFDN